MRLLQVSLRSLLMYSLILVLISIPVSLFSIRGILNKEVDEALLLHSEQFLQHIKTFEYLDDLEFDLKIWDQLSYDFVIIPSDGTITSKQYQTVNLFDSLENEMRPFRLLSTSVDIKTKPYLLTVQMSLVDNEKLIMVLVLVQASLIILLAAGLLLLNRSLSRKLWKPFYNTLNQLKAYQLDKSESIKTDPTDIIEFDDLNKTVSHLTDRNRKIYLQQKEFIENASHELQTPLAIFQSKLDNLMQNQSLTELDATTLMELESTAQRMARLNKNLLLLSKIDNEQYTDKEEIELSRLIQELIAELEPMAEMENITITTDIHPLFIRANKTLTEVLLTNLLQNAVRHTTLKNSVTVTLNNQKLSVINSGTPLKMSHEKMFERFSKETKSENSTGLGLAIVKKICDTCKYELNYNYLNESHEFTVSF